LHISYNTDKYSQTGKVEDLYYEILMREGVQYKFKLILEGLHAYLVLRNTDGNIFGSNMPNNSIDYGKAMYHVSYEWSIGVDSDSNDSDNEDDGLP